MTRIQALQSARRRAATIPVRTETPDCWLPVPQIEVPWLLAHGASADAVDAMQRRSIRATFEAAAAMAQGASSK
jgi:hypothetical protein